MAAWCTFVSCAISRPLWELYVIEGVDDGELLRCARRRHGVVADVEVDVELGILDPVREVEPHRHFDEPAPERREQIDALEDDLLGRFQAGTARRASGVVDVQRRHVTERARRLHVEETDVDTAQLAHDRSL